MKPIGGGWVAGRRERVASPPFSVKPSIPSRPQQQMEKWNQNSLEHFRLNSISIHLQVIKHFNFILNMLRPSVTDDGFCSL